MRGFLYALWASLAVPTLPARADSLFKEAKRRELLKPPPDDLHTGKAATGTRFRVSYEVDTPSRDVPFNRLHTWKIHVERIDKVAMPFTLNFTGDMPRHRHGLPTVPKLKDIGGGRYIVSGLKFHMPGWWRLSVEVKDAVGSEWFRFDRVL